MDHYFISYSSIDGAEFGLPLADAIAAGPPPYKVWVYDRKGRPGEAWDEQIVEALRRCRGLLFVMTDDSVQDESGCKDEWVRALQYKKPVIPLRFHPVELPFRLGSREYIDFTDSFDTGLARLRSHLAWMETPEGVLRVLKHRLADLKRELTRTEPQQQARTQDEIAEIRRQVAEQQRLIDDPQAAKRRTEERIASSLAREREPEPKILSEARVRFVNAPPASPPAWFQDRHVETALLGGFLKDDAMRLMTVVGRAGIGKTSMVCRLLKSLEGGELPDDGGPMSVDGIVYLSATGSRRVSVAHLFADMCRLLPEPTCRLLEAIDRDPHASTEGRMQALLDAFPKGRTIVLLDNFEDVVDTRTGEIRDAEIDDALRAILQAPAHGVKVILTTRVAPRAVQLLQPARQMTLELDRGLESPYAENILRAMDRDGKIGLKDAPDALLAAARDRTRGYPRALEALFAILSSDRDTTLHEILTDTQRLLPEHVVQVLVGEAFSRLDSVAQRVMQALAVYGHPVPPEAVDYLLQPFLLGVDSAPVLRRLVNMQFARREAGNYYLHHVDRAYALGRVPDVRPDAQREPEHRRYDLPTLQRRGAAYFRQVRRSESAWASLEDLSPLIAEFELLAASGDHATALEVLTTMLPYLERWGQHRQIERLATRLFREAKEPARSTASGVAGRALLALGDYQHALECLRVPLASAGSEGRREEALSWRLDVAECHAALGGHEEAAREFGRVLDDAGEYPELQVAALLGLGSSAERGDSHDEAEAYYRRALHTYVQHATMVVTDDGTLKVEPRILAEAVRTDSPAAWHPIPEIVSEVCIFGVETSADGVDSSDGVKAPDQEGETEQGVVVTLVLTTAPLANVWTSLAELYWRTDRLADADACCRLALIMYRAMGLDWGVARALALLQRLAFQLSDDDAAAVLAAQEEELKNARESGHRVLEIEILSTLGDSYLQRSRVEPAAAAYRALAHRAAELEDPTLQARADSGLARVEWLKGNLDEAADMLERVLSSGPRDQLLQADVLFTLGAIERARNRRDVAEKHAAAASLAYAAVGARLQQVESERLLASIAIDRRNYNEAVRRLELALPLVRSAGIPSFTVSMLAEVASAYSTAGAREQALAAAEEGYRTASDFALPLSAAEALVTIGWISAELRDFSRAQSAYDEALQLYEKSGTVPGQLYVLRSLARLYDVMNQPDAQIDTTRRAWRMARDFADAGEIREARMAHALALSDNGYHAEAVEHIEAIVAATPSDAEAIGSLGWVLYQAGDFDRSVAESRRALEVDPAQTWTIRNVAHALLANGLPDDAEREYRRAIDDRKGGEHFLETIRVVKRLLAQRPDVPRGAEILRLIEAEQRRLDAESESAKAAGVS